MKHTDQLFQALSSLLGEVFGPTGVIVWNLGRCIAMLAAVLSHHPSNPL